MTTVVSLAHRAPRLIAAVVAAAWVLSGCDGIDGGDGPLPDGGLSEDCEALCGIEDECGLRAFDECVSASCPAGFRDVAEADLCMEAASDCGAVALCPCDERCAKEAECFGSADPGCAEDCSTVVEQDPTAAFLENRCIIESACADLALCAGAG